MKRVLHVSISILLLLSICTGCSSTTSQKNKQYRLTKCSCSDVQWWEYEYDDAGSVARVTYHEYGYLDAKTGQYVNGDKEYIYTSTYTCNEAGIPISLTLKTHGDHGDGVYTFDVENGRVTGYTMDDSFNIACAKLNNVKYTPNRTDYEYDENGNLTSYVHKTYYYFADGNASADSKKRTYEYDDNNKLSAMYVDLGLSTGGLTKIEPHYDEDGIMAEYSVIRKFMSNADDEVTLTYDKNGNIIKETYTSTSGNISVCTYEYEESPIEHEDKNLYTYTVDGLNLLLIGNMETFGKKIGT